MAEALRLQGFREPLGTWTRRVPPPESSPDARALRLELSSRGDRVSGRLWLPRRAGGEHPVVLLQHDAGGSCESPAIASVAARFLRGGAAVAAVDFPLHGARGDHKLARLLAGALAGEPAGELSALVVEFARQAVIDLERAVDALAALDGIAVDRIAYAGIGLGAIVGAAFCALDPRPRAAVLAFGGAGLAPAGVDPGEYVARVAPRPLLLVNAARDDAVPPEAARALHASARAPVEQLWIEGSRHAIPDDALAAMWRFLAPPLELDPPHA